jgi:hypothetical protein
MGLIGDAGLDKFYSIIGCTLSQSKRILEKNLEKSTSSPTVSFMLRNGAINSMRTMPSDAVIVWNKRFERIFTLESELASFLTPSSKDVKDMQDDAMGQLMFNDNYFKCLNIIPFVLFLMAIFKVWIVPALAISTPIFAWILPYVFLKFMYKLPISQEQYGEIMKMVWSGNPLDFKMGSVPGAKKPSMFTARSIIQWIFMGVSFAQSLIQPIQNSMHLYKTDSTAYTNGQRILELKKLYGDFAEDAKMYNVKILLRHSLEDIPEDPRRAIRILMDESQRFRLCMKDLAELEIMWRIANCVSLKSATIVETGGPLLIASNLYDISLGKDAVPSTISFSKISNHAALTGPNGGGKSSFLRSILQAVLLGQTYGVSTADSLILRRFGWISSGLRLQDAPGNLSMFETEVWFAANLLKKEHTRGAPGLVLYDELFHSTNPPDGIRTAEKFLERLWKRESVMSIVSTHVFSLVETAPSHVKKICCNASLEANGSIQYDYAIRNGICSVSSVHSIWKRFEL